MGLRLCSIVPGENACFVANTHILCYRYVRLLGALYMRLTGTSVDCYKYLEPLYNDYRKVKMQNRNGGIYICFYFFINLMFVKVHRKVQPPFDLSLTEFELMHVDEFIDELLHAERVCDVILPRLQVSSHSCFMLQCSKMTTVFIERCIQ